ncbi:uncharacterized protein LOC126777958 [Nymphalis io]|uniref:uncharacterized protein LOC126777958 n=1 Tax=Inachis io TaxID=171585 RepID=UPI002168ED12|nr:uncharacterized protein LOC126777958 [Nymphalis io]
MESIKESLAAMTDLFNSRMNEFQQDLQRTTTPATVPSLSSEFNSFKSFVLTALSGLQRQIEFLAREMDRTEMQRRRKVLLFHGVSEERSEDATARVTSLVAEHLDLPNFSTSSIKSCHRLGRPLDSKPRPIVVKFTETAIRDKVWFAKTKLKGTGVTESEFLTKSRHNVFLEARKRFGINKCWTRDGLIHIIAPDGSRHCAECLSDLDSISTCKSPVQKIPMANTSDKVVLQRSKRVVKK